ncbi:MAG: glycosyl transferase family 1 [Deltaproteobacteria bacterium]|nr:glycosyl transferase family 1 [Deltaproteobacteria bacterium]
MNIAFLTGIERQPGAGGGSVHVSQVAGCLERRGHTLCSNLGNPEEIQAFYVRIDGWPERDVLTGHRRINRHAPCIWEVNAPVEEMRLKNVSEVRLAWLNRRRRAIALLADTAICVSEEMVDYARTCLGIGDAHLVPNGSDPGMFSQEKSDPSLFETDRFNVIWVGSAEYPWQGIRLVRKAAERLLSIDREILFHVTAEGPSSENLRCLGKIPYIDMPRYIASADAGLCLYENIDYYPRFYFSPLEEIVGGILRLKNDRTESQAMGTRGREAVVARYNWDNIALRTEEILSGAIDRANRKGISGAVRYFISSRLAGRHLPREGAMS